MLFAQDFFTSMYNLSQILTNNNIGLNHNTLIIIQKGDIEGAGNAYRLHVQHQTEPVNIFQEGNG
jgi:hypothetical protein